MLSVDRDACLYLQGSKQHKIPDSSSKSCAGDPVMHPEMLAIIGDDDTDELLGLIKAGSDDQTEDSNYDDSSSSSSSEASPGQAPVMSMEVLSVWCQCWYTRSVYLPQLLCTCCCDRASPNCLVTFGNIHTG